jgi:hypothetical protein
MELASSLPLKQRLASAYSKHLELLDATALPASLLPEYTALRAALTAHRPLPGEAAVQATVRKLGAADLDALSARIIALFGDASRAAALRLVEDSGRAAEDTAQTASSLSLQAMA